MFEGGQGCIDVNGDDVTHMSLIGSEALVASGLTS